MIYARVHDQTMANDYHTAMEQIEKHLGLLSEPAEEQKPLAEHERGHVDLVMASIPEVARTIKGATCDTANAIGNELLSEIRQQDVDYDRVTDHGMTQGARFP